MQWLSSHSDVSAQRRYLLSLLILLTGGSQWIRNNYLYILARLLRWVHYQHFYCFCPDNCKMREYIKFGEVRSWQTYDGIKRPNEREQKALGQTRRHQHHQPKQRRLILIAPTTHELLAERTLDRCTDHRSLNLNCAMAMAGQLIVCPDHLEICVLCGWGRVIAQCVNYGLWCSISFVQCIAFRTSDGIWKRNATASIAADCLS